MNEDDDTMMARIPHSSMMRLNRTVNLGALVLLGQELLVLGGLYLPQHYIAASRSLCKKQRSRCSVVLALPLMSCNAVRIQHVTASSCFWITLCTRAE